MQRTNSLLKAVATACLAIVPLIPGCAKSGPAKEYRLRGEITGLDAGGHVATIRHENIPGFMSAMTMGYPVKDPAEFSKLEVGESITATVYVKGDDMWVGDIRRAPK